MVLIRNFSTNSIKQGLIRMEMISYWKNWEKIYEDDGMVLIIGCYDHKNQENGGE